MALEAGVVPPLNELRLVIVGCRRRQGKIPERLFRGDVE
jgi:hypothetical protein